MKLIFSTFLYLIISSLSFGQLTKGHWLVGGYGSIYLHKSNFQIPAFINNGNYTQIDLSPNVGYFLADKFALGLNSTISYLKGKFTIEGNVGGSKLNGQRYLFGAFGRYYFLESEKQTNILVDANYQRGFIRGLNNTKGKLNNFSISAGPVIYFNSSVGIEFLLGYVTELEEYTSQVLREKKNGFQFRIALQIHLIK